MVARVWSVAVELSEGGKTSDMQKVWSPWYVGNQQAKLSWKIKLAQTKPKVPKHNRCLALGCFDLDLPSHTKWLAPWQLVFVILKGFRTPWISGKDRHFQRITLENRKILHNKKWIIITTSFEWIQGTPEKWFGADIHQKIRISPRKSELQAENGRYRPKIGDTVKCICSSQIRTEWPTDQGTATHPKKPPTQIKTVCTNSLRKLCCLFSACFKGKRGIVCTNCPEIVCANCDFIWVGLFFGWVSPPWTEGDQTGFRSSYREGPWWQPETWQDSTLFLRPGIG